MHDPIAAARARPLPQVPSPAFPEVPLVSHTVLLLLVPPGQLLVEVKRSLLLPAFKEGARDSPAQAACVGLQEHGGVEDAEEHPHGEQHRGAGRCQGADAAVGRTEGQIVVVASFKVLKR